VTYFKNRKSTVEWEAPKLVLVPILFVLLFQCTLIPPFLFSPWGRSPRSEDDWQSASGWRAAGSPSSALLLQWLLVLKGLSHEQCSGSMTFWGGSGSGSSDPCFWLMDPDSDPDSDSDPDPDPGSGSCYFRHWPSECQQKTNFVKQVFLIITFWRYIYIILHR